MNSDLEYYTFLLRFSHPSLDPAQITEFFDIEPEYAWKSGDRARTPAGTDLGRLRKESYWCCRYDRMGKAFPSEIDKMIDILSPHRDFLHRIVAEGGRAEFYLQLPGSINIGNTLSYEMLGKIADLKIQLTIEVFPHMNKPEDL